VIGLVATGALVRRYCDLDGTTAAYRFKKALNRSTLHFVMRRAGT
jgi:hypothetical protein